MPSLQSLGAATRINASPGGLATVIPFNDGGFAAVYRAGGDDVFVLFDSNLNAVSGEIFITNDDLISPRTAVLADGRFVVCWMDHDQQIRGAVYNADGTAFSGPFTLVTPTDINVGLSLPNIVAKDSGGFTLIWRDNATVNGVSGAITIRSFNEQGQTAGNSQTLQIPAGNAGDVISVDDLRIANTTVFSFGVLSFERTVVTALVHINGVPSIMYALDNGTLQTLTGGDPGYVYTNPRVTALKSGGFVITYDFVDPSSLTNLTPDANWTTGGTVFNYHLFTNSFTHHDFAIGTTILTNSDASAGVDPSVVTALPDGGFVVTFEPVLSPLGSAYVIDAQQFDRFGTAVGPVSLVAPQGFLPGAGTTLNGVVLTTYQDGPGIYLKGFQPAVVPRGAEPLGSSVGLNSVVSANSPGVAALLNSDFVVTWQDNAGAAWAQLYGSDKTPLANAFQVAVDARQPVVASQADGTFLVVWSTGQQIRGAVYDHLGNVVRASFSLSGDISQLPLLNPAIGAIDGGGYSMAYEADIGGGASHVVTIQLFDALGNANGASVSQTFSPANPLAPPKIAALEARLFGSATVLGQGQAIFASITTQPGTTTGAQAGFSAVGGLAVLTSAAAAGPTMTTVQVSGGEDGSQRAGDRKSTRLNSSHG